MKLARVKTILCIHGVSGSAGAHHWQQETIGHSGDCNKLQESHF